MALRISLNLTSRDLRFFREALQRSRDAVKDADEDEIIDAIASVIEDIRKGGPLPDFINRRLPDLQALTDMLRDTEWQLPVAEREQLLATFIYFGDPEDLIPDDIPGIGYLDDVIMIELLLREMRHVRDAYRDFCAFRENFDREQRGADADVRAAKLGRKRSQLQARMRRRFMSDRRAHRQKGLW